MSREARLVVPHYPHHVTQRGGRGQQTFFGSADYEMYIDLAIKAKDYAGVDIWAYCLMPNHVHLIVVPATVDGLGKFFRTVHAEYARRINRREGWQGHLWQERFRSFVMEEDHLLAAARYVELNPVRAGLSRSAVDWPWSSAIAHAFKLNDDLVNTAALQCLVDDWRQFLGEDIRDVELQNIRAHSANGRPMGPDQFITQLETQTGRSLKEKRPGPKKIR